MREGIRTAHLENPVKTLNTFTIYCHWSLLWNICATNKKFDSNSELFVAWNQAAKIPHLWQPQVYVTKPINLCPRGGNKFRQKKAKGDIQNSYNKSTECHGLNSCVP